ncbi:MAG TPA: hypothetical protein VHQ45_14580 [Gemmatimonadaceae bacterium]|nr:hypothetical protein [Gemmatimonadaceae bacterium]
MRFVLRAATAMLAACTLLAAGCKSGGAEAGTEQQGPVERTTLTVDNQSYLDMNIFVLRSGQRVRLGMASGNRKSTFTIPSNLIFGATQLRFIADPIGADRLPVTNDITVSAGDEVQLMIPPV